MCRSEPAWIRSRLRSDVEFGQFRVQGFEHFHPPLLQPPQKDALARGRSLRSWGCLGVGGAASPPRCARGRPKALWQCLAREASPSRGGPWAGAEHRGRKRPVSSMVASLVDSVTAPSAQEHASVSAVELGQYHPLRPRVATSPASGGPPLCQTGGSGVQHVADMASSVQK